MMRDFPERDWRTFKEVREHALARFYERTMAELSKAIDPVTGDAAQVRYHRLWKMLRERDKELGQAFDEFSRSSALIALVLMCRMKLVTDEELARFSPETQDSVKQILAFDEETPRKKAKQSRQAP